MTKSAMRIARHATSIPFALALLLGTALPAWAAAPQPTNQTFVIHVNSTNATEVGIVDLSSTAGVATPVTFQIDSGNTGNTFSISTLYQFEGQLTVANASGLTNPSPFNLVVSARNTDGTNTCQVTVKIYVPAILSSTNFNLAENSPTGAVVGTVRANLAHPAFAVNTNSDPLALQAFTVAANGQITVADSSLLDFETRTNLALGIIVTDLDADPDVAVTFGKVFITLTDINEPPVFPPGKGLMPVSATNKVVCRIPATDPENQPLTCTILGLEVAAMIVQNQYFTVSPNNEILLTNAVPTTWRPPFILTVSASDGVSTVTNTISVSAALSYSRFGIPLLVPFAGSDLGPSQGLPIQAVTVGSNKQFSVTGMNDSRQGYIEFFPLGFGDSTVYYFGPNFVPTAVVADGTRVIVAGRTRLTNSFLGLHPYCIDLLRFTPDGVLQQTNRLNPSYSSPYVLSVMDMMLDDTNLYVCGGAIGNVSGSREEPYWAQLNPDSLTVNGSLHLFNAVYMYYNMDGGYATALTKEPGKNRIYVAGFQNYVYYWEARWIIVWDWGTGTGFQPFLWAINTTNAAVEARADLGYNVYRGWGPGFQYGYLIKDLAIGKKGASTYVYSAGDVSSGGNQSVYLQQFNTGLQVQGNYAVNCSSAKVRSGSMAVLDESGTPYLYFSGIVPKNTKTTFGPNNIPVNPSGDNFYVMKLGLQFDAVTDWPEPLVITDFDYAPLTGMEVPPIDYGRSDASVFYAGNVRTPCPAAVPYPANRGILLAGNISSGTLTLNQNGNKNSVSPLPGNNLGFLTVVKTDRKFDEPVFLEVRCDFGEVVINSLPRSAIDVLPFLGKGVAVPGNSYTVRVPPYLYVDAGGNYLGNGVTNPPTEQEISKFAVTRYACKGYTVEGTEIIGDNTSYTFTFQSNTIVTFHWRIEHALDIQSDLTGTGALSDGQGGFQRDSTKNLGLTSLASGTPTPSVQKHWVEQDSLVTAFIDGYVLDMYEPGTRYVVTGYVATGAAIISTNYPPPASTITAWYPQARQQISQFTLRRPATLTYLWAIQHNVRVSTSSLDSQDWPGIKVLNDTNQWDRVGSGEFWFFRQTHLMVGARTIKNNLRGALFASGNLTQSDLDWNNIQNNPFQVANDTNTYYGAPITSLTRGTMVTWDFGNKIYPATNYIGNAVDLLAAIEYDTNLYARINLNKAPTVTGSTLSGSTDADMIEWDTVAQKVFPVKPGQFLLHYEDAVSGATSVVLRVTNLFPVVAHYEHLVHPEMPAVKLDPNPNDNIAFLKLVYTVGDGAVNDASFSCTNLGWGTNVLLFSRTDSNAVPYTPASGNRSQESLFVRVVQTLPWTNRLNTAHPPSPTPAYIGTRVSSPNDLADIGTGFVVYTNAHYNTGAYDRTKVADAGPIFLVNRHFYHTADPLTAHDLVVLWYYQRDGMLWSHVAEWFEARWPEPLPLAVDLATNEWPDIESMTSPNGTNYLRRIVVASRLGSEGKDRLGRNQLSFALPRYEQVSVYKQPARSQPGYNPNEEHALIAPSFKFLDQANPPPTAYALRNNFNVTASDESYTSDPFVLVQYLDHGPTNGPGEIKMAVYAIELENPRFGYDNPDRSDNTNDTREFPYVFHYKMKAGEPVQPPYPLGLVIGLTPCKQTDGANVTPARVFWKDWKGQPWAISEGDFNSSFYYPLLENFWVSNTTAMPPGQCIPFVTNAVRYTAVWPDVLPILKAGETLTHAGGEYKADNPGPEQPGLPGVLGWASGEIIFDSQNPLMDNNTAFNNYTARLLAPLEERMVALSAAEAQAFMTLFQPSTGKTTMDGTRWRFNKLPASLGKRLFYDPLGKRLGLKGYVNDKTLGDSTLTASPPPLYVLEPNILTPREALVLSNFVSNPQWLAAVGRLFAISRNPNQLHNPQLSANADSSAYYVGLDQDVYRDAYGNPIDQNGLPIMDQNYDRQKPKLKGLTTAAPLRGLGPGMALAPSPAALDPTSGFTNGYITIVENNNPLVGGPISLFIIKVSKEFRYRGAIKTILSANVFDEEITLRHSGDFGANADDIVYQWFYREEDGSAAALPPSDPWRLFPDQSDNQVRGRGMYQIDLKGTGGLLLADNLFFVRYRHKNDPTPAGPPAGKNSTDWSGTEWERYGRYQTNGDQVKVGTQWAGAANSPSVDGLYYPQLVMGWIKRVLDRVNPFEARISDFRNNSAPATYASMIQELGARYEGPVALNPDKNVIENVGLIALYQTILDRGRALSIDLSSPITTPGINTALLLAATRISDFYMLLGNEAYADAQDPTIGYGDENIDFIGDFGNVASSMFCFENQAGSMLDEELALLRGVPQSFGRPAYNRLFWNFTKSLGEVAYAMNYLINDVNRDGFIDEYDAMILYPQGHGDAWGHYLTAIKSHYQLLQSPYFNWVSRAERYNLMDVVLDVDYLDERKFADAAAARAKVGAEIVNLTYRSRYVEDPDGQWQGYADYDTDRAWGVDGWSRRAGQGALFDWITANSLIPAKDTNGQHDALQRIDRKSVTSLQNIATHLREIQSQYDNANNGLNPLGLASDVVPFDIEASVPDKPHFQQIYDRAQASLITARQSWDYANNTQVRLRQVAANVEGFRQEVFEQDRDYRNRLIEIFGSPYEGTIGPGQAYPAGYVGPDLMLYMYVSVNDVNNETVPPANSTFTAAYAGFKQEIVPTFNFFGITLPTGSYASTVDTYFVNDLTNLTAVTNISALDYRSNGVLVISNLPIAASGYTFRAPSSWGLRASPGELQLSISDLVQAQADLELAISDYNSLIKGIDNKVDLLAAKYKISSDIVVLQDSQLGTTIGLNAVKSVFKIIATGLSIGSKFAKDIVEAGAEGFPKTTPTGGLAVSPGDIFSAARAALKSIESTTGKVMDSFALGFNTAADVVDATKESVMLGLANEIAQQPAKYEIAQSLKELEADLRNEKTARLECFKRLEALRQSSDRYRAALEAGLRLLELRQNFNIKAAGTAQKQRYQDMAFRVFRNDALQKYRAAYDLAARYAYMAAKAYDYETALAPEDRGSAQELLTQIVRARTLGMITDGEPLLGDGLAGVLAMLRDNFGVLQGQLAINNPQNEQEMLSLRKECWRIQTASSGDATWRASLKYYRVTDLWQIPEFRRYCRPPSARSTGPLPGLVIPFSTQILYSKNVFGWPLGAGDHGYDPSVYATKIQSAAVYFQNYKVANLAATPRVYLVPAGMDVMSIPTSAELKTRQWTIVDQAIPVPFATSRSAIENPDWLPVRDCLNGPLAAIRRFASFRAKDVTEFDATADALSYNTRLVARSVWNTRWLLIIPGGSLLADGNEGLDTLIDGARVPGNPSTRDLDGIKDIKLLFNTYGYSGN